MKIREETYFPPAVAYLKVTMGPEDLTALRQEIDWLRVRDRHVFADDSWLTDDDDHSSLESSAPTLFRIYRELPGAAV